MSIAELKELREKVKEHINDADERALRMVYAMLEADKEGEQPSAYELTEEQEAILEERMAKYERGEMKFSSWEDVKSRIISKSRNGI